MSIDITPKNYDSFMLGIASSDGQVINAHDHLTGFNKHMRCDILDKISDVSTTDNIIIQTEYILTDNVKQNYPALNLKFDIPLWLHNNFIKQFFDYKTHPLVNFKNFVCSFNGTAHVSRILLVSTLHKFGYFKNAYCSKNFIYTTDVIDGYIFDFSGEQENFYRKFFITEPSNEFYQTINSFGHVQFDHKTNIYNLENKLTESFLHVVSETLATSYVPFVTEKFLYSIVTRGLFLSYAQPGWHAHIEKHHGFKLYTKLFDYRFDSIINPIERLVELMTMISKFSKLSYDELYDLYLIELETINYNYDHYFSGDYLKMLKNID